MTARPLTARRVAGALVALALATGAASGEARTAGSLPRLVFPVVGEARYSDDFGDPRWQGAHQGIDIVAPRRAVAVAAEAGTVAFWTRSAAAGCMLYLHGRSGATYLYVHLNNDLGPGNDNRGRCLPGVAYAPGLKDGDAVEAGQAVGLVGNSGDADAGLPHLHFEIHPGGGQAVNPFPSLRRARRLLFPVAPGTTVALAIAGTVVRATEEALTLRVSLIRAFPPSLPTARPGGELTVALPQRAQVDVGTTTRLATQVDLAALRGERVLVLTKPTSATLPAALGRPRALLVSRLALASRRGPALTGP